MIIQPTWIAAAQASHKAFYPRGPFPSVSLAQFGLESSWGIHMSGVNNPFGMTGTQAEIDAGQCTIRHTWEQRPDGSWYPREAYFVNFTDLNDAFMKHAALLCEPHYIDCQNAQTAEDYCYALKKDGYATALAYPTSLISIIKSFNLKQYDV